ncbi:cytochrome bo(3) ubiquinol oxidase subunit 3 [Alicyclobacillus cellulosilyticus]|uniref:Cytochrome bo(3) ubiquinol oxidase subunit 3 n=1 Tax=Alicyclobacillus cellulosilyticus TaxID=1003997 RepID=A0A917NFG9_9BACL|nr:cytochrome (ubi)quinol oxidase subunit III [Alicyclobacillus cellulosilyticus]GGI97225.1 cytochrome bo(3) ubiquinol oxidase subunit 3 [Alicyclobacillus cellulosilyticus]
MAVVHEASDAFNVREHGHHHDEDALRIFGFWIFLTSDLILFACLFATYVILSNHTGSGPTPADMFDVPAFTAETIILLTSSFTCGLATFAMHHGRRGLMLTWLIVTLLLGLAFVGLEASEFTRNALAGATMQRSAFLSAFYTLVGTHGCHVSFGILWMTSILIQAWRKGLAGEIPGKVFIVGLYWHFLDVVWVFIFTVVYLMGVMR